MASLGLGTSTSLVRRQLLITPCRTATTPRLLDATPTTRSRLLSSSAFRLHAAAKPALKTIPKPSAPTAKARGAQPAAQPRPPATPTRYAFVKSLGSKTTPTVLYESPSHFWFYFGCWTSGVSILAWTALTGPTVVTQPEGTPEWVGYVFEAAYVLLGSMAFYLLSKTPNIVRSIRLLPPAAAAAATSSPAAPRVAAMPRLEVTVNRMVPVLKPRVLVVSLDDVALKSRFSLPDKYVPELQRRAAAAETRETRRRFDMQHLLTMPFRHVGRAVAGFFQGVRAAWTDMGFATIRVRGKEFKVDVTRGFAHEGFRTLERLVSVGYKSG
ncbi:hypothetical protein ISF_00806 [Cordyceps fumosorosea ARSEF 2679]|uniref:Uncharacterized protein n=1 Tax=Cordyceps fumosorosea (strain ARSEF 2679) TaxID=1081104 RepID=A0A168EJY1_CORFA|nr:hypothetical protein ISF_00806 [Cordyceps fumosorosea ARSEF 2679]OAA73905.1 hypothetical protein ISF_00806 [Cordyceps fumosorosea ARSEF 2679]